MKAIAIAAVVAAAGCWTTGAAPVVAQGGAPWLVWITPEQPWRASREVGQLATDGTIALLAANDWIARLDLATGRIVRERVHDGAQFFDVLHGPGGVWVAIGRFLDGGAAAVIDPDTLELKVSVRGGGAAESAVFVDGGLAIGGLTRQLAIYDPVTGASRSVVDGTPGWIELSGGGTHLYGRGYGSGRGGVRAHFDLATGTRTDLLQREQFDGTPHGRVVYTPLADTSRIHLDRAGQTIPLDPSSRYAVIADDGARLAALDHETARVYDLATGARIAQLALGARGLPRDLPDATALALHGDRLVIAYGVVIRAFDVAAGTASPVGAPPFRSSAHLAIDAGGAVAQLDGHYRRFAGARLIAEERFPAGSRVVPPHPHDPSRYALLHQDERRRLVRAAPGRRPLTLELPNPAVDAWLGRTGDVLVEVRDEVAPRLIHLKDGHQIPLDVLSPHSDLGDVDPDAGLAAFRIEGITRLLRMGRGRDGIAAATFHHPGCAESPRIALERGGSRLMVVAYAGEMTADVAIYRQARAALVGAARFAGHPRLAFVPTQGEVLIFGPGRRELALWHPSTGVVRTLPLPPVLADVHAAAVSADGRRAALSFGDARLGVIDLDALRAEMTENRVTPIRIPRACEGEDAH